MTIKAIPQLFKAALADWREDKATRLAAALAYYTVFSLAPLLIILIAMAGLVLGEEAAQGQIANQIQSLVGQQGGEAIQEMITNANRAGSGILASVMGIL